MGGAPGLSGGGWRRRCVQLAAVRQPVVSSGGRALFGWSCPITVSRLWGSCCGGLASGWGLFAKGGEPLLLASVAVWFAASSAGSRAGLVSCPAGRCLAACWPGGGYLAPTVCPWDGGLAAGGGACSGLLAKESIVSTLGVLCPGDWPGCPSRCPAALSFLLFNLLCAPLPGGPWPPCARDGLPGILVRGGLSDRVGLADRLWGLSGGNAAPPAITLPQGGRAGCATEKRKNSTSAHDKGALVLFKDKVSFRAWHRDRESGVSDAIVSKSSTGRPSPGLQPGLPGPWRQSTGRRFSGWTSMT